MSKLIAEIDQRTRLAGANKMELLMFHLGTDEIYGFPSNSKFSLNVSLPLMHVRSPEDRFSLSPPKMLD